MALKYQSLIDSATDNFQMANEPNQVYTLIVI